MKELIEKLKQILGCVSEEDVREANELADKILIELTSEHKVSAQEVYNILYAKYPNVDLQLWDANYYLLPLDDWKEVLDDVRVGLPDYLKDKFDCENFAIVTSARVALNYLINSCGIAVGGGHAFNLILAFENGKIVPHTYEPQTKGKIEFDLPYLVVDRTVILG